MGGNGTPRRRALGAALREAREAAGYTNLTAFAQLIEVAPATLSRWETGERTPKPTDVVRILTTLGVNGQQFEDILALASDTDAPYWIAVSLPEQRLHLDALLRFERDASKITDVSPLLVTGLLQTEAYIRAMMTAPVAGVPQAEIENRIRVRLGRQRVVDTVELVVILGEAALHQQVGGPQVLADQLRHIVQMAAHPNVTLRVVPFTAGWVPSLEGGWSVIESAEASTVIHTENRRSGQFLHEDQDVRLYRDAVDSLLDVAMSPTESLGLIAEKIRQLEMR